MKTAGIFIAVFLFIHPAHALLVVGDSGSASIYTNGAGAGDAWNYVGHLIGSAPSSVTYISNGWFVTALHVWNNDVVGRNEKSLLLSGATYNMDIASFIAITNANGSGTDLCMFRVTGTNGLPAGMSVAKTLPNRSDSLTLIGNGRDNSAITGLTWGVGTVYSQSLSVYTTVASSGGKDINCYLSVYNTNTAGSAYGQTYDSGGGVFVNGRLIGIMVGIGTGVSDGVTFIANFSVYGNQISNTAGLMDADGDGIPDWWEYQYTNTISALSGTNDDDGDGRTNYDEYVADTNPLDAQSYFPGIADFVVGDSQSFYFTGSPARIYQLYYKTNLADSLWLTAAPAVAGGGTNSSITVTNNDSSAFFRLKVFLP